MSKIPLYKQFAQIWKSVDKKAGANFLAKYGAGDIVFRKEKQKFQNKKNELRANIMPTNKKISEYDHYVAIASAENITNKIMPVIDNVNCKQFLNFLRKY